MAQPHHSKTDPPASPAAASEAIQALRALVDASDIRAAKQQLRRTRTGLDDHTWAMIGEIANTLRYKTHDVALTKLRKLWRDNEQHRALIESCAPKTDAHQNIPDTEPSAARRTETHYRAKPPTRRVDPTKRTDPRHRTVNVGATAVDIYENQLTSEDRINEGTPRDELIVDRRDYDLDASADVTEPLCVSCRLERACIDRWTGQIATGHGDDGLCGTCREEGRPGIPALPLGHTRSQAIHARLDTIATNFDSHAPALFRHEWRYGSPLTKNVTHAWVRQHNPDVTVKPTTTTDSAELNGECAECGDWRQLRDELCVDCHKGLTGEVVLAGTLDPIIIKASARERIINDDPMSEDQTRAPERPDTANNMRYRNEFLRRLSAGQADAADPKRSERSTAVTPNPVNRAVVQPSKDKAVRRRGQLRNQTAVAVGSRRRRI